MNIYERINAVMKDIEYLTKDDDVSTGGSGSYKAISEEKVTSTIRISLIKNGIVIIPVKQEHTREDEKVIDKYKNEKISRLTTVNVIYRIQNIEDKEDYIEAVSSGTGVDTQDKGIGKAMTYAYKYLLLRTFAIPTGEDPDNISSDTYTKQFENKAVEKKENIIKDTEVPTQDKLITIKEVTILKNILKTESNIANMAKKFNKTKLEDFMMTEYVKAIKHIEGLKQKQKEELKGVM